MRKKLFSEIPYLQGNRIVLKRVETEDAPALHEMVNDPDVYRYLPLFLFERKYADTEYVIRHLYDECLKESLILGIFLEDTFCGLAEFYGYREEYRKVSVGYRLARKFWGRGIASEALKCMVRYLEEETDIEIITASTMPENKVSAAVLQKNGFVLVVHNSEEDWGYDRPLATDKWIR